MLDSRNQLQIYDCALKKVIEVQPAGNLELVFHNKFSPSQYCYHGSFSSTPKGLYLLVKSFVFFLIFFSSILILSLGNEICIFCKFTNLGRKDSSSNTK